MPSPWTQAAPAAFFGLAHEICGEMGLGWCRRLQSIAAGLQGERPNPVAVYLSPRYGYSPESAAHALEHRDRIYDEFLELPVPL